MGCASSSNTAINNDNGSPLANIFTCSQANLVGATSQQAFVGNPLMLKFCQTINKQNKDKYAQGQLMIQYIQKGELKKLRQLVGEMGGPDKIDFTSI